MIQYRNVFITGECEAPIIGRKWNKSREETRAGARYWETNQRRPQLMEFTPTGRIRDWTLFYDKLLCEIEFPGGKKVYGWSATPAAPFDGTSRGGTRMIRRYRRHRRRRRRGVFY